MALDAEKVLLMDSSEATAKKYYALFTLKIEPQHPICEVPSSLIDAVDVLSILKPVRN